MKFRSTLGGGYKKEDVNAYIASMQAEFTGIEETLKNTINRQKESMDTMRADAAVTASLREELADITAKYDVLKREYAAARDALEAEKLAHAEVVSKLSDAVAKKAETDARCVALEKQLSDAEAAKEADAELCASELQKEIALPDDYEALKLKAEQYDRMSAHIGAIMLKANANAEELVQRARDEAETMLNGVNAELSEARIKAQGAADTIIGGINSRVTDINQSCREEILADLEEIRAALSRMMDAVQTKYTDIDQKLGYAKDEMDAAAKDIIQRTTAQRVLKK